MVLLQVASSSGYRILLVLLMTNDAIMEEEEVKMKMRIFSTSGKRESIDTDSGFSPHTFHLMTLTSHHQLL